MSAGRLFSIYAVTGVLVSATSVATFVWCHACRATLTIEDGTTEWLTAGLFLASALLGTWRWFACGRRPRSHLLVPAFGLLGMLDELSFGQRLFGFEPPVFAGVRIDAVHDLLEVAYRSLIPSLSHRAEVAILAFLGVLTLGGFAIALRRRHGIPRLCRRHPPLIYVACAALLLLPAQLIDLEILPPFRHAEFFEELLEMDAALTWLFAAFAIRPPERGEP